MGKLYSKCKTFFNKDSHKELFLYIALWLLLSLTPLFSIFMRLSNSPSGTEFPWDELLFIWRQYGIFLAMFLLHNYFLAPLLVDRQRKMLYFSSLAVLLSIFLMLQCSFRPTDLNGPHNFSERSIHDGDGHFGPPPPPFSEDFDRPQDFDGLGPQNFDDQGPQDFDDRGPRDNGDFDNKRHRPPLIIGQHDVIATIIFILMLGMNLGVKLYFRQRKNQERMLHLENENLEQQLEYLKYQINPHFLMNTLNNIHALVDIEPEQAKETIVELSKIMRFVLYEGSKQKVPLRQELVFLDNYIRLMKMRFTDQVTITTNLPDIIPDRELPPLLLITFVENAFKHGVSYQQKSFVNISINIDNTATPETPRLLFKCTNSKIPKDADSHGGVGLQNARRRLELLYGKTYTLAINDSEETYSVTLDLPL